MARRFLPGTEDDQPGTIRALHGRLSVLSSRLDAAEATLGEHGADLTALGRGLAALRGVTPSTPAGETTGVAPADEAAAEGRRDWLAVTDPDTACGWLTDAVTWLVEVGAHHRLELAPCWPLHPEVVAEVLALVDVRASAYTGGPEAVAEWLTRWLPGARDRISEALSKCHGEHLIGTAPYAVSGLDLAAVARWWACDRATRPDVALRAWMRALDPR